jgi:hypothetical protein
MRTFWCITKGTSSCGTFTSAEVGGEHGQGLCDRGGSVSAVVPRPVGRR